MKHKNSNEFYAAFQAFSMQVRDGRTFQTEDDLEDRMAELEVSARALGIPFVLDHERYFNAWLGAKEGDDEDSSSCEDDCEDDSED